MSLDFTIPELNIGGGVPPMQFYKFGLKLGGTGSTPTYQDIVLSGVGSLTLANAKANSLNYLKLYGGCAQRNLPEGYTEYDGLIESDGLAYIDLNCILTQDDEIELEFTKTSNVVSKDIFGSRSSASSNNISVILAGSGNVVEDFNNSDYTDYRLNTGINQNTRYKVVMNKTGRYLYQGSTLVASDTTANSDTITTTGCYLFSLAGTGLGSKFQGIIHRCLIKGKRDVVPAGNGTAYGVYDKLNGVFYTNANTEGSFTVGSETVPTPDYPVDVVCNNGAIKFSPNEANYIEDNVTLGYWLRNTDGNPELSSANFYTNYMPVKPNVSYIAYGRNKSNDVISGYNRIAWYDIDKNWISNTTYTANTIGKGIAPANAYFARFHCNINGVTVTQELVDSYNWTFQMGTEEVPYMPYVEGGIYYDGTTETIQDSLNNTATAQNLFAVGTVKDVQEVLTGAITRNIGIKVLDGTESWTKASGYTNIFYAPISGAYYNDSSAERIAVPCTHFVGTDATNTNMADNTIKLTAQGSALTNPLIYIKASVSNDDLTTWQNWLAAQYAAGTPVIIIFPKKTATSETVTGQSLTTKSGSNTITITQASISNLPLEVSYKGIATE